MFHKKVRSIFTSYQSKLWYIEDKPQGYLSIAVVLTMVDKVSACLVASLAISENGKVRFGVGGSAALSQHHYAVGCVLASRKSVDPKAFMGTITKIWGFQNRLSINEHGSGRFIFKFSRLLERDQIVKGGPWFFGKAMVVLASYDGLGDPTKVELTSFPVWEHHWSSIGFGDC